MNKYLSEIINLVTNFAIIYSLKIPNYSENMTFLFRI